MGGRLAAIRRAKSSAARCNDDRRVLSHSRQAATLQIRKFLEKLENLLFLRGEKRWRNKAGQRNFSPSSSQMANALHPFFESFQRKYFIYICIQWGNLNEETQTKRSNQRRISSPLETKIRDLFVFVSLRAYTEYKSPSLVCRRKIVVTELYSCFETTLRKQYLLFNEPTSVVSKFPPLPPLFLYLHEE